MLYGLPVPAGLALGPLKVVASSQEGSSRGNFSRNFNFSVGWLELELPGIIVTAP